METNVRSAPKLKVRFVPHAVSKGLFLFLISCCLFTAGIKFQAGTPPLRWSATVKPLRGSAQSFTETALLRRLAAAPNNESAPPDLIQALLSEDNPPLASEPPLTVDLLLERLNAWPPFARSGSTTFRGASCAHREEKAAYHWAPLAEAPTFARVAAAYERFHARCTAAGGNFSALLASGRAPPCKVLVFTVPKQNGGGLGNQLLGLVSTLLWGMLTSRVVLVDQNAVPAELLCEPFQGSSWLLPKTPPFEDGAISACNTDGDGASPPLWERHVARGSPVTFLDVMHCSHGRLALFSAAASCALEELDWMAVLSNQYFLPSLYHQTRFLGVLRALFADNRPSAHVMRQFFNPNNAAWGLVKQAYAENMEGHGYKIGAQLRFFQQPVDADDFLRRLVRCGHTTGRLPKVRELTNSVNENIGPHTGLTNSSLLVGSLDARVKEGVRSIYSAPRNAKLRFRVFFSNNDTRDDYNSREHKQAALADVWLLSYTQTLIITPQSTFGYVMKALGNAETWVLDGDLEGCSKVRSLEPCYQVPPVDYDYYLLEKARSDGRGLGFHQSLVGVLSTCEDQYGGLSMVTK